MSELTGKPWLLGRLEALFLRVLFLRGIGLSYLTDKKKKKNRMVLGGRHTVRYSTGLTLKREVCASFELLRG